MVRPRRQLWFRCSDGRTITNPADNTGLWYSCASAKPSPRTELSCKRRPHRHTDSSSAAQRPRAPAARAFWVCARQIGKVNVVQQAPASLSCIPASSNCLSRSAASMATLQANKKAMRKAIGAVLRALAPSDVHTQCRSRYQIADICLTPSLPHCYS